MATDLPGDPCGLGQVGSFRLGDVENKDAAKSKNKKPWLLVGILALLVGLTFEADEGSQNRDAFLTLADESTQLVPGTDTGDVRGIRPVARDGENVAEALCHLPDYVERMPLDRRKARSYCRCALRCLT